MGTGSIAEMQKEMRSAEEAQATSTQVVSEARREIEELRVKVEVVDKLEAEKRAAAETNEEAKECQLELEKNIAATEKQKVEREEQIRYLQEKYEKLGTSASIANLEHQNVQALLQAKLVTAGEREQELNSIQVQLQDQISLEAEISSTEENRLKAEQHIAMLETQLQDEAIAIHAKELKRWERIDTLQGKLGVCDEQLKSLRLASPAAQEEISRQLATVQDCQRKGDAWNQDLREQLASVQQLASKLQPQLDAAQVKAAQTLLSRLRVFLTYGACCVCPVMVSTQSQSRGGSRKGLCLH